jgi:AraC family transcriptional regulator of adaptative response/methylated-DNA-[protein]-cysteine methyltransferase
MNTPLSHSLSYQQRCDDYARVEQAIAYLESHADAQPELSEVAAHVGLSEYHFQRLFSEWVGISPKRFLQFLTKEGAKLLLERSISLTETTYRVGLSSPGRLHDLFVAAEAVTPGEYKAHGEGMVIRYGLHPTPFGECLLGATERGICHLSFVEAAGPAAALADFSQRWARAERVEAPQHTAGYIRQIFESHSPTGLRLHLRGTNFQLKVWEALLQIPPGYVTHYQDVAIHLGLPTASRAVGSAVGDNPIAVLIPCHRVIRRDGGLGGYRYGLTRKKALLGWELLED